MPSPPPPPLARSQAPSVLKPQYYVYEHATHTNQASHALARAASSSRDKVPCNSRIICVFCVSEIDGSIRWQLFVHFDSVLQSVNTQNGQLARAMHQYVRASFWVWYVIIAPHINKNMVQTDSWLLEATRGSSLT